MSSHPTHVIVIGGAEPARRALEDAAATIDGMTVETVDDVARAEQRLAARAGEVDAVVLGPVENASGVAKTCLTRAPRAAIHVLGDAATAQAARALLDTVQAAAHAQRARHELLLSMIAHDVRAPLGVALNALSEMTHPSVGALNEEQQTLMRLAKRSLDRLTRLTVNLSQLARLDARRVVLARGRADLGALAREVAHRAAQSEESAASIEVDAAPAFADVDREKMGIALENVLHNALRFARTRVRVRAKRDGGDVVLVVEDDGPGLPAGVADVFDRVRAADERSGKTGSGLGLAVVRGILRAHGGDATAETTPHGARFTLRVAAAD